MDLVAQLVWTQADAATRLRLTTASRAVAQMRPLARLRTWREVLLARRVWRAWRRGIRREPRRPYVASFRRRLHDDETPVLPFV